MKRLNFIFSLFGFQAAAQLEKSAPVITAKTQTTVCPFAHTLVEDLGALAIGADGRVEGDPYFKTVGWISEFHLHVCLQCGVVFVVGKRVIANQ
jgi:hypothetical protein